MPWSDFGVWWLGEVEGDPAYEDVVTPLLLEVFQPKRGERYLDIGCGEGRLLRTIESLGATCFGVELDENLARHAGRRCAAGQANALPFGESSVDGAVIVLVLEHIESYQLALREAARVVRPGGHLGLVMNHPTWTAPHSTPITDADGEVLWRPGDYFSNGFSEVPTRDASVRFYHRTMSSLLNAAAFEGWALDHMIEQPHHDLTDQQGIPRLIGCRWRLSVGR